MAANLVHIHLKRVHSITPKNVFSRELFEFSSQVPFEHRGDRKRLEQLAKALYTGYKPRTGLLPECQCSEALGLTADAESSCVLFLARAVWNLCGRTMLADSIRIGSDYTADWALRILWRLVSLKPVLESCKGTLVTLPDSEEEVINRSIKKKSVGKKDDFKDLSWDFLIEFLLQRRSVSEHIVSVLFEILTDNIRIPGAIVGSSLFPF